MVSLSFELGKLSPEIKEKYKARKIHFQKYKKVPLCQGSENNFPEIYEKFHYARVLNLPFQKYEFHFPKIRKAFF